MPCVAEEVQDLDILKSILFTLNSAYDFIQNNKDSDFLNRAKGLLNKIFKIEVGEKYKKKFTESVLRVMNKMNEDFDRKVEVSAWTQMEFDSFAKKLCRHQLEIITPILEIQKILGLQPKVEIDNSYCSVLKALEEITTYIKTIKSIN